MADVAAPQAPSEGKIDPSKFLSDILQSSVTVKLHNGVQYSGDLQSIDGYMNIVLQGTRELIDGKEIRAYGDVFIRGNNVPTSHIHPQSAQILNEKNEPQQ